MAVAAAPKQNGHLGLGLTYLSGATNKSLGNPNAQYSLEFATFRGGSFASYIFKFRVDSSSGKASFLDGGTAKSLTYSQFGGTGAIGFRINPIPVPREKGIIIYFGATGNIGLVSLRLPDQTYTSLTPSQSAMSLGYEIFAGADFILGPPTKPWGFFTEIALKEQNANLGGQSTFSLGGIMIMGGYTW